MTRTAAHLLAASGLPMLDARALLAHRLHVPRERLIAHPELPVGEDDAAAFERSAERRLAGEPLAYLLGEKEFYGRSFLVTPDVLVPRPETERLVELALDHMRDVPRPRVLDLGTGSGCIAITLALERRTARVTATDVSAESLRVAASNARRLGATTVEFRAGAWYDAVPAAARYDLIVSNPPYVAPGDPHLDALRFEPLHALTDGRDGMACLEAVIAGAASHAEPATWVIVEHGFDQADGVRALFTRAGWRAESHRDPAGQWRVTSAQQDPR